MNIFYLDSDPRLCAKYHCDKHVVKMIIEYAQMLSTAHRVLDGVDSDVLYKATHVNHPSNIWVRSAKQHYNWLYTLFIELSMEYTARYNKAHKTFSKLNKILNRPPKNIPASPFSEPPLAMPDECKLGDVINSYRNFYKLKKVRFAKWKNGNVPTWFEEK